MKNLEKSKRFIKIEPDDFENINIVTFYQNTNWLRIDSDAEFVKVKVSNPSLDTKLSISEINDEYPGKWYFAFFEDNYFGNGTSSRTDKFTRQNYLVEIEEYFEKDSKRKII